MPIRIFRDVVLLVQDGHELVDNHLRVPVVERVVLGRTVGRFVAPFLRRGFRLLGRAARVDEHREHHGNFPAIDQVVEDIRRAYIALHVLECLSVVENHQAGRDRRVVLRRHVDPVGVLRAGICLAGQRVRSAHLTRRHAVAWKRVRPELVMNVGVCRLGRGRWRCRWGCRLLSQRPGCGRGENHDGKNISTHRLSPC